MVDQFLTEERKIKLQHAAANSQLNAAVVLENVHDPHNIGAVLRSCDSVGIRDVFVLYNEESENARKLSVGLNSSSGALKWVRVHFYEDTNKCMLEVKKRYGLVAGTHLSEKSVPLYDMDLTSSIAFVFGNERDGISNKVKSFLDTNFIIPQFGMVQSLNISVACAVTVFEMARQRMLHGMYNSVYQTDNNLHKNLYEGFIENHYNSLKSKSRV
ncbi:MAG: RNA methyltransferase [Saprospiraceae bacterium]|nr:RNA methyltransferase [Saprospiraceae bacterium]